MAPPSVVRPLSLVPSTACASGSRIPRVERARNRLGRRPSKRPLLQGPGEDLHLRRPASDLALGYLLLWVPNFPRQNRRGKPPATPANQVELARPGPTR